MDEHVDVDAMETGDLETGDLEIGVTPVKPGAVNWLIASACTAGCAALGAALIFATG
jgi:hypothetical protein